MLPSFFGGLQITFALVAFCLYQTFTKHLLISVTDLAPDWQKILESSCAKSSPLTFQCHYLLYLTTLTGASQLSSFSFNAVQGHDVFMIKSVEYRVLAGGGVSKCHLHSRQTVKVKQLPFKCRHQEKSVTAGRTFFFFRNFFP